MNMKISYLKEKLIFTALYIALITVLYLLEVGCVFRVQLGVVCPGCGMTRAVLSLLHFDFVGAFKAHPMVFSLPVLYLYFLIDGGLFKSKLWDTLLLSLIGLGFLVNWLVNLV